MNAAVGAIRAIATATLLAAVALNISNVVGRYFLDAPIAWAEEVMLFLQVGVVFLGAVVVAREGRHIRMDVVVDLLPPAPRRVFAYLAGMVEIGVAVTITWLAVPLVRMLWEFDQRSQAADLPVWIPQGLVPLGFALIALATVTRLLKR